MKMFTFKPELPTTIEDLNRIEERQLNDDTILIAIYMTIFLILVGLSFSFVAHRLNQFNEQVQKTFIVS